MKNVVPRFTFVDTNPAVVEAFQDHLPSGGVAPSDEIILGDWTEALPADCVVSPANAFGLMDGGMDQALTDFFGPLLQQEVRHAIHHEYAGTQPIGTCLIVPTSHDDCPFLAHAPTMFLPADIRGSLYVYAAFRSIIVATTRNIHCGHVICPGLGTLTGNVPPQIAALQMKLAWIHTTNDLQHRHWFKPGDENQRIWNHAHARQDELTQAADTLSDIMTGRIPVDQASV